MTKFILRQYHKIKRTLIEWKKGTCYMSKFNLIKKNNTRVKSKQSVSILSTLFIPYTLLFALSFFIVSFIFISAEVKRIRNDAFLSIENNVTYTSDFFDQMVNSLDTASQNIIYSNLVKSHFSKYLGYSENDSENDYDSLQNTKILNDLLIAIMGPNTLVDQTYLYGMENGVFGVGRDNHSRNESVKDCSWYNRISSTHGEKCIYVDKDMRLKPYSSYDEGSYFLSLTRKYYNSLNVPQGYIETKKSMSEVSSAISSLNLSYNEKLYVFNSDGNILFPYIEEDFSKEDAIIYRDLCFNNNSNNIQSIALNKSDLIEMSDTYILCQHSSYTDFTTVAVVSKHLLLESAKDYLIQTIFFLILFGLIIAVVSYYIAKKISNPLGKIYSQISSFDISSNDIENNELPDIETSIIEINGLYNALLKMQQKTKIALEHELQLQTREMQSRMLALQAQMNPHFLYNSLATIQALADEGMTDEVYYLCQNISDILRYISSDSDQMVCLHDEIKHTKSYLECMKLRYNNELSYNINIPDEMMDYKIPKLCLQLIVENAIKFSTKKKGPWLIKIDGLLTSQYWEIHTTDNGPGFSSEALKTLQKEIDKIDQTGSLPNLEINGMGLLNIYIRFKLLYKGKHIFRLSNNVSEGARVTIGGAIE